MDVSGESHRFCLFCSWVASSRCFFSLRFKIGVLNLCVVCHPECFTRQETWRSAAEAPGRHYQSFSSSICPTTEYVCNFITKYINIWKRKVSHPVGCHQIAEEEALMAAALFPMLREIDIHSNPLTTQRSGNPLLSTLWPVISSFFLNLDFGNLLHAFVWAQETLPYWPTTSGRDWG